MYHSAWNFVLFSIFVVSMCVTLTERLFLPTRRLFIIDFRKYVSVLKYAYCTISGFYSFFSMINLYWWYQYSWRFLFFSYGEYQKFGQFSYMLKLKYFRCRYLHYICSHEFDGKSLIQKYYTIVQVYPTIEIEYLYVRAKLYHECMLFLFSTFLKTFISKWMNRYRYRKLLKLY